MVSAVNTVCEAPRLAAGVNVSPPDAGGGVRAAAALLSLPDLQVVQVTLAAAIIKYPYLPGLLAFRVAPAMLEALGLLESASDFIIVEGHGLAHPRGFGLACHLGVLTGFPTIGCAGAVLVGTNDPPAAEKGAWAPLRVGNEVVGAVLRTRDGARPVYVSVGSGVDLDAAIKWTLECCSKYRNPEPLRVARRAARAGG